MKVKVGFVLLSNSSYPIPSTRIAILNLFPFLDDAHFDVKIVYEPELPNETPDISYLGPQIIAEGFRVIVFQKVHGASVEQLALNLATAGIYTLYCVCDLVNVGMASVTDATIVVTEFLKTLYPANLQSKIFVVHDGIEHPELWKKEIRQHSGSTREPLRAILVTSSNLDRLPVLKFPPKWLRVTIVGRYSAETDLWSRVRDARWQLARQHTNIDRLECVRFMINRRVFCVPWRAEKVYRQMLESDIGIIPIDRSEQESANALPPSWKVKSENRLTMKMGLGLPVVATPIPSYMSIIQSGKNGFFADRKSDWLKNLEYLRDPELRLQISRAARSDVLERFSIGEQARLFIQVLRELIPMDPPPIQQHY